MPNDEPKPQGFVSVSTSDPEINAGDERLASWARHPETSMSVDTAQPPDAAPDATSNSAADRHRANGAAREESRAPAKPPRAEGTSIAASWRTLLLVGAVAFVLGAAGAWAYTVTLGSTGSDQKNSQAKGDDKKSSEKKSGDQKQGKKKSGGDKGGGSEGGDDADSASQLPGFTSADDAAVLKKQIKHLEDRIDRLSHRVDQATRPEDETPPVLHTLQSQMNDLAREVDQVAGLPARLHRLERQLASLQEQLELVRTRNSASDESPGVDFADGAEPPETATPGGNDPTLDLAIGLFQEGQYKQTRQVLRRLQREYPKDARVWYFSALANALASGAWEGETEVLVKKGVECERSGTPSKAAIDAALAVLTPRTGADWLARHRRDAQTRQAKK